MAAVGHSTLCSLSGSPPVAHLEVIVRVWPAAAMLMRFALDIDRHDDELAVSHPSLLDDVIAEVAHLIRLASHQRDLEATAMIEVNARGCDHQIVMMGTGLRQPLGQLTDIAVVHVNQGCDAGFAFVTRFVSDALEARTNDVANGL